MAPAQQEQERPKTRALTPELRRRLIILGAKILGALLIFYILAFRIYGLVRIETNAMSPSVKGGDLALIFHLKSDFAVGDVVNYRCNDHTCTGRIAAKAGDTIDLNEEGKITINGHIEDTVSYGDHTLPGNSSVSYPYKVSEEQYFILGDNRSDHDDSRFFGAINKSEIKGQVIGLFRIHGI